MVVSLIRPTSMPLFWVLKMPWSGRARSVSRSHSDPERTFGITGTGRSKCAVEPMCLDVVELSRFRLAIVLAWMLPRDLRTQTDSTAFADLQ